MDNFTTAFTALEPANMTISPRSSTNSTNITDLRGIGDSLRYNLYYNVLLGAESVVCLLGNLMVIIAVCRYEDLQIATGYLLANLAVADAIIVPGVMMTYIVEKMERTSMWLALCTSQQTLIFLSAFGNIITLTMMSIDRLIALGTPFWYRTRMSVSKVLPFQIVIWIGIILTYSLTFTLRSTATGTIPICIYTFLISTQDILLFMLCPYYFFTAVTIINYIVLSCMVWRQGRQLASQSSTLANQMLLRQAKLTKTTSLVLLAYLVLTTPTTIAFVVTSENAAFIHIQYVAAVLWHLNTVINPFIYAYRMPRFRQAFRKMLGLKPHVSLQAPVLTAVANVARQEQLEMQARSRPTEIQYN